MRLLWYSKRWKELKNDTNVIFITSNRMRAYNFHDVMKDLPGIQSDIAGLTVEDPNPFEYDVIIFQKVLNSRLAFMLKRSGITTVLDACDVLKLPSYLPLVLSGLTTSNAELADSFRHQSVQIPIHVIPDAHEADPGKIKVHEANERLFVTMYGTPSTTEWSLRSILPIVSKIPWIEFRCAAGTNTFTDYWQTVTCNDRSVQFNMEWKSAWSQRDSWQNFIFSSDVGVIPSAEARPRSNHKALNYMAYGIPVICYPSPDHKSLIRHGENGFLAQTEKEWVGAFEQLRDPAVRTRIGKQARQDVLERYSLATIGGAYAEKLSQWHDEDVKRTSSFTRLMHRVGKVAREAIPS